MEASTAVKLLSMAVAVVKWFFHVRQYQLLSCLAIG